LAQAAGSSQVEHASLAWMAQPNDAAARESKAGDPANDARSVKLLERVRNDVNEQLRSVQGLINIDLHALRAELESKVGYAELEQSISSQRDGLLSELKGVLATDMNGLKLQVEAVSQALSQRVDSLHRRLDELFWASPVDAPNAADAKNVAAPVAVQEQEAGCVHGDGPATVSGPKSIAERLADGASNGASLEGSSLLPLSTDVVQGPRAAEVVQANGGVTAFEDALLVRRLDERLQQVEAALAQLSVQSGSDGVPVSGSAALIAPRGADDGVAPASHATKMAKDSQAFAKPTSSGSARPPSEIKAPEVGLPGFADINIVTRLEARLDHLESAFGQSMAIRSREGAQILDDAGVGEARLASSKSCAPDASGAAAVPVPVFAPDAPFTGDAPAESTVLETGTGVTAGDTCTLEVLPSAKASVPDFVANVPVSGLSIGAQEPLSVGDLSQDGMPTVGAIPLQSPQLMPDSRDISSVVRELAARVSRLEESAIQAALAPGLPDCRLDRSGGAVSTPENFASFASTEPGGSLAYEHDDSAKLGPSREISGATLQVEAIDGAVRKPDRMHESVGRPVELAHTTGRGGHGMPDAATILVPIVEDQDSVPAERSRDCGAPSPLGGTLPNEGSKTAPSAGKVSCQPDGKSVRHIGVMARNQDIRQVEIQTQAQELPDASLSCMAIAPGAADVIVTESRPTAEAFTNTPQAPSGTASGTPMRPMAPTTFLGSAAGVDKDALKRLELRLELLENSPNALELRSLHQRVDRLEAAALDSPDVGALASQSSTAEGSPPALGKLVELQVDLQRLKIRFEYLERCLPPDVHKALRYFEPHGPGEPIARDGDEACALSKFAEDLISTKALAQDALREVRNISRAICGLQRDNDAHSAKLHDCIRAQTSLAARVDTALPNVLHLVEELVQHLCQQQDGGSGSAVVLPQHLRALCIDFASQMPAGTSSFVSQEAFRSALDATHRDVQASLETLRQELDASLKDKADNAHLKTLAVQLESASARTHQHHQYLMQHHIGHMSEYGSDDAAAVRGKLRCLCCDKAVAHNPVPLGSHATGNRKSVLPQIQQAGGRHLNAAGPIRSSSAAGLRGV